MRADAYIALAHSGRIHYAERGERRAARPSALLIHGAGASSAIWMMVLARVARAGHAVAIDLPGHGPSATEGTALDGTPGLTLARYRDAVGELAGTLCSAPRCSSGTRWARWSRRRRAGVADKVRGWCCARRRACRSTELAGCCAPIPSGPAVARGHALSPRRPAVRRGFLAAGEATPAAVTRADFEIVRATDVSARIGALACPVIWLDGADDRIVAAADGRKGAITTLPDVGHLTPIEAPAAVADAIAAALA